jgi:hypothetical protein
MQKKYWKNKVIRACPGWTVLEVAPGDEELFETAVIAWAIQYEEDYEGEIVSVHVMPVTTYGEPGRLHGLESPDGKVSRYFKEFRNREELLKKLMNIKTEEKVEKVDD